jgi:hypothetical protein
LAMRARKLTVVAGALGAVPAAVGAALSSVRASSRSVGPVRGGTAANTVSAGSPCSSDRSAIAAYVRAGPPRLSTGDTRGHARRGTMSLSTSRAPRRARARPLTARATRYIVVGACLALRLGMTLLLVILLLLALFGGGFGYSRYGYGSWSPAAIIVVILVVMLLTGRL